MVDERNDKVEKTAELYGAFVENSVNLLETYVSLETDNQERFTNLLEILTELFASVDDTKTKMLLAKMNREMLIVHGNRSEVSYAMSGFADSLSKFLAFAGGDEAVTEIDISEDYVNRSDRLRDLAEKGVANGYTTDEIKDLFNKI